MRLKLTFLIAKAISQVSLKLGPSLAIIGDKKLTFLVIYLALYASYSAAGNEHLVSASSQITSINSKLGSQDIKILSPLGLVARYDYRPGFSNSLYVDYKLVSDSKGILLNSYGFGGDYSILGGMTKRYSSGDDHSFEFYYGYRLTVFAGLSFGAYDFGNVDNSQLFLSGEKIKTKGRFSGFETGLGMEFNLAGDSILILRLSYSSPSIENSSKQSANFLSISAGLGKTL